MSSTNKKKCKEKQYNDLLEYKDSTKLGLMSGHTYRTDPRRLTFLLSRYKFVSKMFDGLNSALEVGCGDGFGSTLVADTVSKLTCMDFDPIFIANAKDIRDEKENITFLEHDILKDSLKSKFDGIYSLDVLEHIASGKNEDIYMKNILNSLNENGTVILGMPSLESQEYASVQSKIGHINCKSGKDLKEFCEKYFHNVFIFSMNDEVVHTGFYPMAHYLLALCTNKK